MCVYIYIYLAAGCRVPPNIGCRQMPGAGYCRCAALPGAAPRRLLVRHRHLAGPVFGPWTPVRRRMSVRHRHLVGPVLVGQNLFKGQGHLHSCSTHKHKDNSFCSTLYMVRALFVLSMWDISQFSLFLSQLPTHIS